LGESEARGPVRTRLDGWLFHDLLTFAFTARNRPTCRPGTLPPRDALAIDRPKLERRALWTARRDDGRRIPFVEYLLGQSSEGSRTSSPIC